MINEMARAVVNNFTSTGVNSKLLTVNDEPLRFYLDGFDIWSFLRTTAVIESHGGKVTPVDDETVVLAPPKHPTELEYLRFDVNWLYDTVKSNGRLDIGKYLLDTPGETAPWDAPPEVNNRSYDTDDFTLRRNVSDAPTLIPIVTECRIQPKVVNGAPPSIARVDTTDGDVNGTHVSANQAGSSRRKEQNDELTAGNLGNHAAYDSEAESNFNGWPSVKRPASVSKSRRSSRYYTTEEQQKIVNYLIDNDLIADARKTYVWKLMEADAVVQNRPWYGLMKQFKTKIVHNVHVYTEDTEALEQFAVVRQSIKPNNKTKK